MKRPARQFAREHRPRVGHTHTGAQSGIVRTAAASRAIEFELVAFESFGRRNLHRNLLPTLGMKNENIRPNEEAAAAAARLA